MASPFVGELHVRYLKGLREAMKDSVDFAAAEHLKTSALYWQTMALHIIGGDEAIRDDRAAILEFLVTCRHSDGSYGGNKGHDGHLLHTLSALQLLAIYRDLDTLSAEEKDSTARWIAGLQQADGSFVGDKWGEVDTRYCYCAIQALTLLNRIELIDVKRAVAAVVACSNFDGGFGAVPGAESHAGQVFCCLGALAMCGALDLAKSDQLSWWLAERQCDSGGLNGRSEKQADVCYSWWVLSCLVMLKQTRWIDNDALVGFILRCQDATDGGISDRPGNTSDVYHTYFGAGGLALLGYNTTTTAAGSTSGSATINDGSGGGGIDAVFALPPAVVRHITAAGKDKGAAAVAAAGGGGAAEAGGSSGGGE